MLETQALGEADLIVTLLSERHGRIRGVARSARSSRRRFGGVLEPLTRVRATWNEREGRELARIDALDLVRSYARMQADPTTQAACAVIAEVGLAFTHDAQPEPHVYRLCGVVLDALEDGADPFAMLRYFEYWMLRLHGLLPSFDQCADCGAPVDPTGGWAAAGGLRCAACSRPVGPRTLKLGEPSRRFLEGAARCAPRDLPPATGIERPGGVLELLLRGSLEIFTERVFHSYRHLAAAAETLRPGGTT